MFPTPVARTRNAGMTTGGFNPVNHGAPSAPPASPGQQTNDGARRPSRSAGTADEDGHAARFGSGNFWGEPKFAQPRGEWERSAGPAAVHAYPVAPARAEAARPAAPPAQQIIQRGPLLTGPLCECPPCPSCNFSPSCEVDLSGCLKTSTAIALTAAACYGIYEGFAWHYA